MSSEDPAAVAPRWSDLIGQLADRIAADATSFQHALTRSKRDRLSIGPALGACAAADGSHIPWQQARDIAIAKHSLKRPHLLRRLPQ